MKTSLRKSLLLFSLREQGSLIIAIIKNKYGWRLTEKQFRLFLEMAEYTRLIESGVHLVKYSSHEILTELELNGKSLRMIVRRHTSDLEVFKTVILAEEYKQAAQCLTENDDKQSYIFDAGANIGAATLYFLAFSPCARVIAVEPDKENYECLLRNIQINGYEKQVVPVNGALWTRDTGLKIVNTFRDGHAWSLTVEEVSQVEQAEFYGYTLEKLMASHNVPYLTLLKIDIEGGERFLFIEQRFLSTIKARVNALVLEIHDEFNIGNRICESMEMLGFKQTYDGLVSLFVRSQNENVSVL
ncbi:MAG TPA: FkbM family methyltransferase [Lacibacter sp.]|nr:FkbM family methyltransferase [Lacibacter sp.]HMP85638.1 FkbM family methyltransferase [Lacibacter sp.]